MNKLKTLPPYLEIQFYRVYNNFERYEELTQKHYALVVPTVFSSVLLFIIALLGRYFLFPRVSIVAILLFVCAMGLLSFILRRQFILSDKRELQRLYKYFQETRTQGLIVLMLEAMADKYDYYDQFSGSSLYQGLAVRSPDYTFEQYQKDYVEYKRVYLFRKTILQKMQALSSDHGSGLSFLNSGQ